MDKKSPRADGKGYATQITYVADRPGHDRRYAIDSAKIRRELGWSPKENFDTGIEKTVDWYLTHRSWTADIDWRDLAQKHLELYLCSVPAEVRHRLQRYHLVDAAMKAVGVGSVGTRCAIGLFIGPHPDDLLILQSKQAEASVFEPYATTPSPQHQGQRVIEGQRLMQTVSDPFLGWTSSLQRDRCYYWRLLRNWKGSVDLASLDAKGLELYGELCGRALAKAHARSGDRHAIAAWLAAGKVFDQALEAFGLHYADQAESDYRLFMQAIKDGRLEASTIF